MAAGALYKQRRINIEKDGLRLLDLTPRAD